MDLTRTITQAMTDYEAFSDTVLARLGDTFGPREWVESDEPATYAFCGDDDAGKKAILPRRTFEGTYDAARRDEVRDLVIELGKEAGFAAPELVVEKDDYLKIVAEDAHGGRYTFTSSANTVFSVWTGCHAPD